MRRQWRLAGRRSNTPKSDRSSKSLIPSGELALEGSLTLFAFIHPTWPDVGHAPVSDRPLGQ